MMNRSNKAKEMSFARRHPAVELIERAMEGADRNVVCLLNEESRVFVVFKLFQEVWRRHRKAGKMVLLVDNERGRWLDRCIQSIERNLEFSVPISAVFPGLFSPNERTKTSQNTHTQEEKFK